MPRQQVSVPIALIIIVAGLAVMYYVLHAHGWSLNGPVPLAETFRHLSISLRALVVAGIVAVAWGTGAAVNGLVRQK
jgi:uncharacterized membrane protein (DUF373 family)